MHAAKSSKSSASPPGTSPPPPSPPPLLRQHLPKQFVDEEIFGNLQRHLNLHQAHEVRQGRAGRASFGERIELASATSWCGPAPLFTMQELFLLLPSRTRKASWMQHKNLGAFGGKLPLSYQRKVNRASYSVSRLRVLSFNWENMRPYWRRANGVWKRCHWYKASAAS